ncbi:UNVERIFIED_CONTAM: hypothetical protein GTU68_015204 [Idotea baltica]|nr:hypothetical protein [Idotea baltica]
MIEIGKTNLRTIRDYIRRSVTCFEMHSVFFGHGTDNAWDEARLLVLGALHLPWNIADNYLDCRLEEDEQQQIISFLNQRIEKRIPVAYLLGEAWFCDFLFKVDTRVLIPRSPFSELILNKFRPWLKKTPETILDLCTGSGCIGIACAHTFPETTVLLSDISYDALEVAYQNIELHHLEERVYTVQSDGFSGLTKQRFDLIVSNPPYVDAADFADMPEEYLHEPELGLSCGKDGLDLVRHLLAKAAEHLTEEGLLFIEVGNSFQHVCALYPEIEFSWLEFKQGGHGVFVLTAQECQDYSVLFNQRLLQN